MLIGQLPKGPLRTDLETRLTTIPPSRGDVDAIGVGLTIHNSDYDSLRDALRAIRRSGIEVSVELTKLQAALEAIAERATVDKALGSDRTT